MKNVNLSKLSILYVGNLNGYSNSYRRFKSLQQMGHEVNGVDSDKYIYGNIFKKFHHHLNIGPGMHGLNKEIVKQTALYKPDILWVDNRSYIRAATLKKARKLLPAVKIVNLITDDPTGQYKHAWRLSLATAGLYDCHFVQREVNIHEMKAAGAGRVELCYRSFDPSFHRPIELTPADKLKYSTTVGFIGTYEANREEFIAYLINNNIPVKVVGDGWPDGKHWNVIRPYYGGASIYGEEYVKIINGMQIAIHFLRHANRDEQDSRTFEIPACAVFMIAERSKVHSDLFQEGKEAVFFETKEQLLEQVKYYINHPHERQVIAKNGYQRSIDSGYDHLSTLKEVIRKIYLS